MDISKTKKVGTREEVYKGIALRTAGSLKKDDIIEKRIGNRVIYISKKLSDKMKENVNILRTHNPNFLKKMQKKTTVSTSIVESQPTQQQNTQQQTIQQTNIKQKDTQQNKQLLTTNTKQQKHNTHSKTQKLSFKVKDNSVRTIFYPELQGMDLKELKEDILREEAEEDLGITLPKKPLGKFSIVDMPDIDINNLD